MTDLHSQAEYQPYLDELTAFASTEPKKADLLGSKASYFELTGEIFEDDKQFKMIFKEVKRRKKKEPQRAPQELVFDCARRALKVDRYRQIAVERIYDFENKTI